MIGRLTIDPQSQNLLPVLLLDDIVKTCLRRGDMVNRDTFVPCENIVEQGCINIRGNVLQDTPVATCTCTRMALWLLLYSAMIASWVSVSFYLFIFVFCLLPFLFSWSCFLMVRMVSGVHLAFVLRSARVAVVAVAVERYHSHSHSKSGRAQTVLQTVDHGFGMTSAILNNCSQSADKVSGGAFVSKQWRTFRLSC